MGTCSEMSGLLTLKTPDICEQVGTGTRPGMARSSRASSHQKWLEEAISADMLLAAGSPAVPIARAPRGVLPLKA